MSQTFTEAEVATMEELALTCRPALGKSPSGWTLQQLFAGLQLATIMAGGQFPFGIRRVPEELPHLLHGYPWPDAATV